MGGPTGGNKGQPLHVPVQLVLLSPSPVLVQFVLSFPSSTSAGIKLLTENPPCSLPASSLVSSEIIFSILQNFGY